MCASELVGTALLVGIGLSIVILDEGRGSLVAKVLPSPAGRLALTGLLFGATGMTIALSPVGKIRGAHINPVVSVAFWLERTLPGRALLPFIMSQLAQLLALLLGTVGRHRDCRARPALAPAAGGSRSRYRQARPFRE
jgi:aquaporin Z